MKQLLGCLVAASLFAGCSLLKVNVNGKTLSLPGSGPAASAPSGGVQGAIAEKTQAINDKRVVETVAIDPALTDVPRVARAEGVGVVATFKNTLGIQSPDCGQYTSHKPLVSFKLDQPMPKSFTVAVEGAREDGFVLKRGDLLWTTCTSYSGQLPSMGAPAEGWVAGTYEIYPVSRSKFDKGETFNVEFFNPENVAKPGPDVKKISIAKKLDKPMFVEVTTKKGRTKLREVHSGQGCQKTPLSAEPDFILELARPIPGIVVRPLYTKTPVALRVHTPDTSKEKGRKYCAAYRRAVVANNYAPTYESPVEAHLAKDAEGAYAFSLGTENADEELKVTLMIFDESTKWDPLAVVPPQGELPLEERYLAPYYPQLDTREATVGKHEQMALHTKLFASAPKELFVYSKLDLDKDVARLNSGYVDSEIWPKKNEPMLLLGINNDHANVLTADGVRYSLKVSHLLPAPDGSVAKASAPRPLKKTVDYGDLTRMAPPSAKSIADAYGSRMKKYDSCADRVWKPFGKKLDGARWTVRSASGNTTTVESPRAQQIREQGQKAIDKSCGSDEKLRKDKETTRLKILAEVEKERAKLLSKANSRF